MWSQLVLIIWIAALTFTVLTFIYRRQLILPLLAAIFWIAAAYSLVQIDFYGFGSTSVITYNTELGDRYGEEEAFWLAGSVATIMLVVGFTDLLQASRQTLINSWEKPGRDMLTEEQWRGK